MQNILGQHTAAPNVVLSHPDLDHYSRITSVLDGITVASVWQGGDPFNYTSGSFPVWLSQQESSGGADPCKAQIEAVAAALPNARIVVIEGKEHFADALVPKQFAEKLMSFLQEGH